MHTLRLGQLPGLFEEAVGDEIAEVGFLEPHTGVADQFDRGLANDRAGEATHITGDGVENLRLDGGVNDHAVEGIDAGGGDPLWIGTGVDCHRASGADIEGDPAEVAVAIATGDDGNRIAPQVGGGALQGILGLVGSCRAVVPVDRHQSGVGDAARSRGGVDVGRLGVGQPGHQFIATAGDDQVDARIQLRDERLFIGQALQVTGQHDQIGPLRLQRGDFRVHRGGHAPHHCRAGRADIGEGFGRGTDDAHLLVAGGGRDRLQHALGNPPRVHVRLQARLGGEVEVSRQKGGGVVCLRVGDEFGQHPGAKVEFMIANRHGVIADQAHSDRVVESA